MIGPSTVLVGLLTDDGGRDGHIARLYNYLMGHNHLDAAYVMFVVKVEHVDRTVKGMVASGRPRLLHVAPALQHEVGRALGVDRPVERLSIEGPARAASAGGDALEGELLAPAAVARRARSELEALAGRPLEVPEDLLAVVDEPGLRPCQLTSTGVGPT